MDFQPWDNLMGADGFEFIEYAALDTRILGALSESIEFGQIKRGDPKDEKRSI